ncbi:unnamed protein product [Arctia plantaginis]|uniref:Uncharacterized protein n=1 Tax=Arctia plantaginis TaxID=874455 RepID=A0A8S1BSJ0_ARCPL|nr:unnamed protein product [Arctia plantaginis]
MARSPQRGVSSDMDVKCSGCNVLINELLAFVCNKVDTLAETAIVQICMSAFAESEIENARQIVFNLLAPSRKITRRKDGNQQKSVKDIVKIIKETEPDCLPVFVARDLNKLPPVTFDHIDVTTFLKEMSLLKKEVAIIRSGKSETASHSPMVEISSLQSEIQQLKKLVQDTLLHSGRKDTQVLLEQSTKNVSITMDNLSCNMNEALEIKPCADKMARNSIPLNMCGRDSYVVNGGVESGGSGRYAERLPERSTTTNETTRSTGTEVTGYASTRTVQDVPGPAPRASGVMITAERSEYTMADAVKSGER